MYPKKKTALQDKSKWSKKHEPGQDKNGSNQLHRRLQMMSLNACRSALETSSGGSVNSSSQTSSSSSSDSSVILSKYQPFTKRSLLPPTIVSSPSSSSSSSSSSPPRILPTRMSYPDDLPPSPVVIGGKVVKVAKKQAKVVVALYDFYPLNPDTDLPLVKSQEYEVVTEKIDGCPGWWVVRNKNGGRGCIPANYVKEKTQIKQQQQRTEEQLQQQQPLRASASSSSSSYSSNAHGDYYDYYYSPAWYLPQLDRRSAERILKSDGRVGTFVVRYSTSQCSFTISLLVKAQHPSQPEEVKHYLIRQTSDASCYYLSEHQRFNSLESLINFHRQESATLAVRLKHWPSTIDDWVKNGDKQNTLSQMYGDKSWEIRASDLTLLEELGSGQFGVVRRGKWTRLIVDSKSGHQKQVALEIAVKLMKEGTMSEADFVREAKVMTKLRHPNLVQLYGLCIEHRPICIVTEFMKHGSLLSFLRSRGSQLKQNATQLLAMCLQVCDGMAYLEAKNYIHRDLAARNCLVGNGYKVKVADFGLARFVADSNEYTSSTCTKFPIRWAPPEVLWYTKFSSKSDIWAFGVLMWEVFTCGQMPYGKATNAQVVELIRSGDRLDKPRLCSREVFNLMQQCWQELPEDRPDFSQLYAQLNTLSTE